MDLNEAIEQIMKVLAGEASVRGVLSGRARAGTFESQRRCGAVTAGDPKPRTQRHGCDA